MPTILNAPSPSFPNRYDQTSTSELLRHRLLAMIVANESKRKNRFVALYTQDVATAQNSTAHHCRPLPGEQATATSD